ncbi:SGNH hydrolase-type esterase domain-containing protein [Immersiella caudata]|uniref:SGNH hydrolase-type esterase domain-containing protein n=1 Tax=Immersiella caudata TaxID=314043 RepID=A0AA39U6E1_9PEZI|nr:SGNH hydrolase-type esterase domain-containing protein [Immersiella caudata]
MLPAAAAWLLWATLWSDALSSVSLDFVQRWAAIGDSFTAGIGSGARLSNLPLTGSSTCSRHVHTWPNLVNLYIGSTSKSFQYTACSGARTEGVFQQANALPSSLDVVMLTAGGNDLCLAAMIRRCVILPYDGEAACTAVINKAQQNIDTILKPNIREILDALKPKMRSDRKGIVVYSSYAPFFNTQNEDCATKHQWAQRQWELWKYWQFLRNPLPLTIARRQRLNTLVHNINRAIKEVVDEYQRDPNRSYDIAFSDWSEWPADVGGQFCDPRSSGRYPDANQPDLLFFKPDTTMGLRFSQDRNFERRDLVAAKANLTSGDQPFSDEDWQETDPVEAEAEALREIYRSSMHLSPDPRAEVLHRLDARAPAPAGCPGDEGISPPNLGFGLLDFIGRIFHPNELGHEAIAAFALQTLAEAKARQDGGSGDVCSYRPDEFRCWRMESRRAFVRWETIDKLYQTACSDIGRSAPSGEANWRRTVTYNENMPEEIEFVVHLSGGAHQFNEGECREAMERIANSCDGADSSNPLNVKYGGRYKTGNYAYEINPQFSDRQHLTGVSGHCRGHWRVLFSDYHIQGKGWLGDDNGEALRKAAKSYLDFPDDNDGWEWTAFFRTPIWTNARCFDNLKVQRNAGGLTHHWRGSPADERDAPMGCAGTG